MSPKIEQLQTRITEKKIEYSVDIRALQREIQRWEQEIRLSEIDKLAKGSASLFVELQMAIAKDLKAYPEFQKSIKIEIYKDTYNFLDFVENQIDLETFAVVAKKAVNFAKLIEHYSNYCNKVEQEYDIELPSERALKS